MSSQVENRRGRVTLSIHIPIQRMELLDRAIAASGQSTSRFIMEAALARAEQLVGENTDGGNA